MQKMRVHLGACICINKPAPHCNKVKAKCVACIAINSVAGRHRFTVDSFTFSLHGNAGRPLSLRKILVLKISVSERIEKLILEVH